MLRYIIWTILLYGLFSFIFNFLIPVFRATRQMKSQVREFQDRMNTGNPYNSHSPKEGPGQQRPPAPDSKKTGDYIDFEEVRS